MLARAGRSSRDGDAATEHAARVKARAEKIAADDTARRRAKAEAKRVKIDALAARREREGAYVSASGSVVHQSVEKSPVKRREAGAVNGRKGGGEGRGTATARAAWVSPSDENDGGESARSYAEAIVRRVIETASETEIEEAVRACVAKAMDGVIKANSAPAVVGSSKFVTPATKLVKSSASADSSQSSGTPKPKTAMEMNLSERLSAARSKATELEAEIAKSPLRSPFKDRMKAGVRESPIQRLKGAARRTYKRTAHEVTRRVEILKEKHPKATAGAVLGLAVVVLLSRGNRDPARPRSK